MSAMTSARCLATVGIVVWGLLLALAQNNTTEICGIPSPNTENMNRNAEFSRTLFAATTQVVPGLSYDFYRRSCPNYKDIITAIVDKAVTANPLHAAGILRIMFHDCFIQGCDASVLLDGRDGEQTAPPNLSLRQDSLQLLDLIKLTLEEKCPKTVSCSDIILVAAAAAIKQVRGPTINVPVGRRDSNTRASNNSIVSALPSPFDNISKLLPKFVSVGLDSRDMVALSGAHTIGEAHCGVFTNRLRPVLDTNMDVNLANKLKALCPDSKSHNVHGLDSTPHIFDNSYFKDMLTGKVLLLSDASLALDPNAKKLVKLYADDMDSFNNQFIISFVKLSQIRVLTGSAGQVRTSCRAINGRTTS